MAYSLVTGQIAQTETSAVTTASVALPNNPTTGNLVVVCMSMGSSSGGTMTVKDGAATPNSYTATTHTPLISTTTGGTVGIWFFIATATANKTLTFTTTGTPTAIDLFAAEYSGNASSSVLETDATNDTGVATTNPILPSITTANVDLLVSAIHDAGSISAANSPWTGWPGGVPASGDYAEYVIQSSAGARAINFTSTSAAFAAIEAAFKPSAGASPMPPGQVWM